MEKEFNNISEKMTSLTNLNLDDDDKLILYGYYKQSTCGDCNINEPSFYDLKGKAKYNAWKENKGIKKEIAMQRYIRKAKSFI